MTEEKHSNEQNIYLERRRSCYNIGRDKERSSARVKRYYQVKLSTWKSFNITFLHQHLLKNIRLVKILFSRNEKRQNEVLSENINPT